MAASAGLLPDAERPRCRSPIAAADAGPETPFRDPSRHCRAGACAGQHARSSRNGTLSPPDELRGLGRSICRACASTTASTPTNAWPQAHTSSDERGCATRRFAAVRGLRPQQQTSGPAAALKPAAAAECRCRGLMPAGRADDEMGRSANRAKTSKTDVAKVAAVAAVDPRVGGRRHRPGQHRHCAGGGLDLRHQPDDGAGPAQRWRRRHRLPVQQQARAQRRPTNRPRRGQGGDVPRRWC